MGAALIAGSAVFTAENAEECGEMRRKEVCNSWRCEFPVLNTCTCELSRWLGLFYLGLGRGQDAQIDHLAGADGWNLDSNAAGGFDAIAKTGNDKMEL